MQIIELQPTTTISDSKLSYNLPIAFALDKTLRWTYLAANIRDVFRIDPAALLGKPIFSFFEKKDESGIVDAIRQVNEKSIPQLAVVECRTSETISRDVILTLARAISDEHETEGFFGQIVLKSLNEKFSPRLYSEDRESTFDAVFDHAMEGICLFDPRDMRVEKMNPAFEHLIGYSSDELLHVPMYLFLDEEKDRIDAAIRNGESRKRHHVHFVRKDGITFERECGFIALSQGNASRSAMFVHAQTANANARETKSENRLLRFIENINDVFYHYNVKESRYEFISPSVLPQTGYTVEEYMQNPQEFSQKTTVEDDLSLVFHKIRQHLAKGPSCGPVELQYRFIKKDGSIIWVSDVKNFEFDARGSVESVNGIIRDISHHKAVEIRLRDSEEYFRTMFESSPDGLVIFDLPMTRFEINHQITRMFGFDQHELIENPWELLERIPQNIIQSRMDRLEREGNLEYNAIHFTKSGKVLYCNVKCSRFHTSKGDLYVAVIRDMTEKRSLEFQLQQYSQQLEKLVEQRTQELTYYSERLEQMVKERTAKLEAMNNELEQFAYSISHDLRAPLVCIEGFSELLREDVYYNLSDEHKEWVDIILSSTRRMNKLIADVLELARIGRVVGKPAEVHVGEMLQDIKQEFIFTLEKKNAELIIPEALPILNIDAQRLRQVFQNLISNALKYNDKDRPRIEVRYEESETQHHFTIADNGIGIPPERKEEVFLLFRRLTSSDEVEGTGAGLTIVRKIIQHLGGEISLESTLGEGTSFHFTIPKMQE